MDYFVKGIIIVVSIIAIIAIVGGLVVSFYPQIVGNKSLIDTRYKFTKALITIGNETIEVKVDRWMDYDGEQIQIIAEDGTVYLVSSFNTVMMSK